MKFICEFINVVIGNKTGELLEYWHLVQQSKYKEEWGMSSGNEVV